MFEIILKLSENVLSGIAIVILGKIIEILYSFFRNKNNHSISGFWVSNYKSAFDSDAVANDIVWIRRCGGYLIITYQQYCDKSKKCNIFKGEGYFNNRGVVSFSYQYNSAEAKQVGTMILSEIDIVNTKKMLVGRFFEFDSRKSEQYNITVNNCNLHLYGMNYDMVRCKMDLMRKIKYFFNLPVYKSHRDVSSLYEQSVKST